MPRKASSPVLVIHGGAGARGPLNERTLRRRAMLVAVKRASNILKAGGSALDEVVTAVIAMEDDPLFNAGYGSVLNSEGRVEMDASVMVFPFTGDQRNSMRGQVGPIGAGAVAMVSRVRNPVLLARVVMERTPHVLMAGAGAEALASSAGVDRCRPEELISKRARTRWRSYKGRATSPGTVGAVALDVHAQIAAATSTGGITGKLPGRVGDSAIVGAGTFVDPAGAASATGIGEAIMKHTLCREAVRLLAHNNPDRAAKLAIESLRRATGGEAGVIIVDRLGRIGYAHNAEMMEIAIFTPASGIRHHRLVN